MKILEIAKSDYVMIAWMVKMNEDIKIPIYYPLYIVKVNDSDSIYCECNSIDHWQDWSGLFYKSTAEKVEDHINLHFPLKRNKKLSFAVFIKENEKTGWKFVKKIR